MVGDSRFQYFDIFYLSNAIQKYCRDTGFAWDGVWKKWGPYGFAKDGRQCIQEYYPDALAQTYMGVSGYIYCAESITDSGFEVKIPDAATSSQPEPTRSNAAAKRSWRKRRYSRPSRTVISGAMHTRKDTLQACV